MNKVIGIIIGVVVAGSIAVFALASKNGSTDPSTQSSQSENMPSEGQSGSETSQGNEVIMKNLSFGPSKITVKKGTTVTWVNQDDAKHDVNPDNPTAEFKKSDLFGKGGTYSVTFDTAGTYTYKCTPHPFMKGTVEVTE